MILHHSHDTYMTLKPFGYEPNAPSRIASLGVNGRQFQCSNQASAAKGIFFTSNFREPCNHPNLHAGRDSKKLRLETPDQVSRRTWRDIKLNN